MHPYIFKGDYCVVDVQMAAKPNTQQLVYPCNSRAEWYDREIIDQTTGAKFNRADYACLPKAWSDCLRGRVALCLTIRSWYAG